MANPDSHAIHFTALRCFFLLAQHHGIKLEPANLSSPDQTNSLASILKEMDKVGLNSKVVHNRKWGHLIALGSAFPVVAIHKNLNWMIVVGTVTVEDGQISVMVVTPGGEAEGARVLSAEEFLDIWNGTLILCRRKLLKIRKPQSFGFSWFTPEIMRQGRYFRDIAIATTMINLIGFATPILFQVIIDKVVAFKSYQTLLTVILVYVFCIISDGVFSYVRQYLMVFATNKIDASLCSKTFGHLLTLPLQFFESRSAGILVLNMHQTAAIRQFLTGRLFQVLMDSTMLPVLLLVMSFYSGKLTVLILVYAIMFAAVLGILLPTYRVYLEQLYAADSRRQAILVETIHGMRTIKSLAVEPVRMEGWDNAVVETVRRHGKVGRLMALSSVLTGTLEKILTIAILGIGVTDVFDGVMTLGSLIAFNMLSGRVTGPLTQIVNLINDYQQAALAVKMLGAVMDHKAERELGQSGARPNITGQLEFDNVTFSYPGSVSPAVSQVSFKIEEGQMVGIVGRSGSGKTTITRLIQGIHTAQEGLIRLNNLDLRQIDLAHLRGSIGVVLQDNFLFRGTLRENISIAKPNAPLDEIIEVVRLAGADEFIDRLPRSYDTLVEEGGANFSGGQRQRIAIARALLLRPRLLIFDEATSALDPDSEAIIQNNLEDIARNRTLLIVSHRLSSLVPADMTLVLEQGQVADFAPHSQLVERCDVYRHLWLQQTKHIT